MHSGKQVYYPTTKVCRVSYMYIHRHTLKILHLCPVWIVHVPPLRLGVCKQAFVLRKPLHWVLGREGCKEGSHFLWVEMFLLFLLHVFIKALPKAPQGWHAVTYIVWLSVRCSICLRLMLHQIHVHTSVVCTYIVQVSYVYKCHVFKHPLISVKNKVMFTRTKHKPVPT